MFNYEPSSSLTMVTSYLSLHFFLPLLNTANSLLAIQKFSVWHQVVTGLHKLSSITLYKVAETLYLCNCLLLSKTLIPISKIIEVWELFFFFSSWKRTSTQLCFIQSSFSISSQCFYYKPDYPNQKQFIAQLEDFSCNWWPVASRNS